MAVEACGEGSTLSENCGRPPVRQRRGEAPRATTAQPTVRPESSESPEGPSRTATESGNPVSNSNRRMSINHSVAPAQQRGPHLPADEESAPAFFNRKRKAQQLNNPKIARNTRAQVRVAALNIKGRRGTSIKELGHKWHDIHRMLFDEKIGVMAVTETHLSVQRARKIQQDEYLSKRMEIFNSIAMERPGRKGVAMVLNREITNTVGIKFRRLIPGRAILATIPWHGKITLRFLRYMLRQTPRLKTENSGKGYMIYG